MPVRRASCGKCLRRACSPTVQSTRLSLRSAVGSRWAVSVTLSLSYSLSHAQLFPGYPLSFYLSVSLICPLTFRNKNARLAMCTNMTAGAAPSLRRRLRALLYNLMESVYRRHPSSVACLGVAKLPNFSAWRVTSDHQSCAQCEACSEEDRRAEIRVRMAREKHSSEDVLNHHT